MNSFYIKTNRTFTPIRKYAWIFTFLVAFGGLWYPKLGLLVIPIMFSLMTTAFFKGRFWCGNFCSHGSLFDSLIMPISKNGKIPNFFAHKATAIIFFTWFGFNLIRKFIRVAGIYNTYLFWDRLGFIFVASYLMVTIVGIPLSIFFASRTWCHICPMGILQKTSYKIGKLLKVNKNTDKKITISSTEMCHNCAKCARVCPMQLDPYLEFSENNQLDNEACIRCSTCVENCPAGILTLNTEKDTVKISGELDLKGYENREIIKAKIIEINNISYDIKEYVFKFIDPEVKSYKPGQFILVKISDNPRMHRAYSISSHDKTNKTLSVIIKKMDDGYGTNIIFNTFKVGHPVELEGPMGDELVIDQSAKKVLFVANGIGITPFIPMSKDAIENHKNITDIKLVYGVRYENEFIYDDYFKQLASKNETFDYMKVSSKPKSKDMIKGYVTDAIKDMDLENYKVYICGSKPMITNTLELLKTKGVNEEDIYFESA